MKVSKLVADYRSQKSAVIKYVERKGVERLSEWCALVGIPLIAAYTYVKEECPAFTEECDRQIQIAIWFYKYEE